MQKNTVPWDLKIRLIFGFPMVRDKNVHCMHPEGTQKSFHFFGALWLHAVHILISYIAPQAEFFFDLFPLRREHVN
jgi:hypothetical protein